MNGPSMKRLNSVPYSFTLVYVITMRTVAEIRHLMGYYEESTDGQTNISLFRG